MLPKLYVATDHDIDSSLIDPDALWVVHKLREAQFEAFIVGGSIRDLLAGVRPKDFDISTSALPEEIKTLFGRRCLLIGRRFRLAHIRFGNKVIEVATFRSGENADDLIVRDNQWGNAEEDVLRRDFTINGLFYDPEQHTVIDYVGGWQDIHKGTLRAIGDPIVRFKQDPVRMIRLLKFQARFGFAISDDAKEALNICRSELTKSSPARILEEIFRMLESGASAPFLRLMQEGGLLELIFPTLTHVLQDDRGHAIYNLLQHADAIHLQAPGKKPLDRALLAACLLFPILENEVKLAYSDPATPPSLGHIMMLTHDLIRAFVTSSFAHFPKRLTAVAAFILTTQYRLAPLNGKPNPKIKLMRHPDFPLSISFLKLRALIDDSLNSSLTYWSDLMAKHEKSHPREEEAPRRPRRRNRNRRRRPA